MNELAKTILDDGQTLRAIDTYLNETFNDLKHKGLGDEQPFTDRIDFFKYVKSVLDFSITILEDDKLSEPESYEEGNK